MNRRSKFARGTCSRCGRDYPLRDDGTVRKHFALARGGPHCTGSAHPPLPSTNPEDHRGGCPQPGCICNDRLRSPLCSRFMGIVGTDHHCPRCGWAEHLHPAHETTTHGGPASEHQ